MSEPSPILDRIEAAKNVPGTRCRVALVLEKLDADAAAAFGAAINGNTKRYEAAAISRVLLDDYGVTLAAGTIRRHRQAECKCPTS